MKESEQDVEQSLESAFSLLCLNVELNDYALENVVMGRIRPGEKIPFASYVQDLGYAACDFRAVRTQMEGNVLDADERIRNRDIREYYRRRFFNFHMSYIFDEAPKESFDFGDDAMFLFEQDMRGYINNAFPLFCDILDERVEYSPFDIKPSYMAAVRRGGHFRTEKLLSDIKLKALRQGVCVDSYFVREEIPFFVERLLEKKKGKYYLCNNDTDGVAYKLAVFSAFRLKGSENDFLLKTKIVRWAESHAV